MSVDRAADREFQILIVERDGRCIFCGETRHEYLCGHHLITRGNPASRYDLRNGVTVCTGLRERWVDGKGRQERPCHDLVEDDKNWAIEGAVRHFINLGYFGNATEYVRWSGRARCGEVVP